MNENEKFNIYGARMSAKGNGVNITLVTGEDESKKFAYVYIPFDFKKKVHAEKTEDGQAFAIIIPKLEANKKKDTDVEEQVKVAQAVEAYGEDDLPF